MRTVVQYNPDGSVSACFTITRFDGKPEQLPVHPRQIEIANSFEPGDVCKNYKVDVATKTLKKK